MKLSVGDVRDRVEAIFRHKGFYRQGEEDVWNDDEAAHVEEDSIHRDVLESIAAGDCEDPAACAAEALKTAQYKFARWCA